MLSPRQQRSFVSSSIVVESPMKEQYSESSAGVSPEDRGRELYFPFVSSGWVRGHLSS